MGTTRPAVAGLVIAGGLALVLTLVYFGATGSWTRLGNPIPGVVAIIAGVVGAAIATFVTHPHRWRRRRPPDGTETQT